MIEFLILFAIIWLVIASISDLKKREVANWLSFSLIVFALGYRLIYSVVNFNLMFFVYGLFGFGVFFVLAYIFYYARVFAGGDAKLFMGLGAVLALYGSFFLNIVILISFVLVLLIAGSLYGLIYSFVLVSINKKKFVKEFKKQFDKRKVMIYVGFVLAALSFVFVFYIQEVVLVFLPLIILLFPVLFIYAKSVEESCMIVEVSGSKVTVGDWLYEEVIVKVNGRNKKIKPYWEGLSEEDANLLKKYRGKVKIKQGIPFVPVFLISYIVLLFISYLRNSQGILFGY